VCACDESVGQRGQGSTGADSAPPKGSIDDHGQPVKRFPPWSNQSLALSVGRPSALGVLSRRCKAGWGSPYRTHIQKNSSTIFALLCQPTWVVPGFAFCTIMWEAFDRCLQPTPFGKVFPFRPRPLALHGVWRWNARGSVDSPLCWRFGLVCPCVPAWSGGMPSYPTLYAMGHLQGDVRAQDLLGVGGGETALL